MIHRQLSLPPHPLSHPQPLFPKNPLPFPQQQESSRMIQIRLQQELPPNRPLPHPLSQPHPQPFLDKSPMRKPPKTIYTSSYAG